MKWKVFIWFVFTFYMFTCCIKCIVPSPYQLRHGCLFNNPIRLGSNDNLLNWWRKKNLIACYDRFLLHWITTQHAKEATLEYWGAPHDFPLKGCMLELALAPLPTTHSRPWRREGHPEGCQRRRRRGLDEWEVRRVTTEEVVNGSGSGNRLTMCVPWNPEAACHTSTGSPACTLMTMCTRMGREGPYSFNQSSADSRRGASAADRLKCRMWGFTTRS